MNKQSKNRGFYYIIIQIIYKASSRSPWVPAQKQEIVRLRARTKSPTLAARYKIRVVAWLAYLNEERSVNREVDTPRAAHSDRLYQSHDREEHTANGLSLNQAGC